MAHDEGMPSQVFFDCSPEGFNILDAASLKASFGRGSPEPWMSFKMGPGNVIETTPKKVVSNSDDVIGVECEDGVVYIDLYDSTAKKQKDGRQWRYMGGIDRRNDGLGYIPDS